MSELLAMVHENAADLYEAGLMDKKTMKKFDELCLTPVPTFTPDEIKAIREKEHVSQTVFAHYLNVSKNMISEWERGVKKPTGTALKLLTLVQHKGIDILV
ncbi:DNA-binding transcriptional regulator [Aggregatibacter actinomycetemcomitans]|uniref:helix-turn-helix domain-containing protein n=1 Tax=Aggregatibacter actinomycetemcomitans TaxID=714 RepID=UPI001D346886|nr:DNA-binding transcriptional regulator [Aggregatibacter actinomycetemcomitans]MBN6068774.1 DNA-binding transcriptional regulator [Aggregatibacter actinomycetemcomitans]MBN6079929.1 DNA-binding transcriptional regulator [Aggregatibacter actinomycetemcomitans]MBN6086729.1 DNA-binding transcriptional regulator [Aggregatibacter actinomycetemcomitans]